jgi:hypothetical protein
MKNLYGRNPLSEAEFIKKRIDWDKALKNFNIIWNEINVHHTMCKLQASKRFTNH